MDHFQNQSDGNPIRTGGATFGTTSGLAGTGLHHGGGLGTLRRSNSSSSSSSSEDDGHGGRRNKGLKQKIKEKLRGGHRADQPGLQHSEGKDLYAGGPVTTPVGGYGACEHHQRKKGILGKIKDKLPGNH